MKKICLIGNNAFGKPVSDGQRIKLRSYIHALQYEGYDINFVELENPLFRLFKIVFRIKKNIKFCDIILLIAADKGERILIPIINHFNKNLKKRFIFSQIGTSFLYKYLKKLDEKEKNNFLIEHNFYTFRPSRSIKRNLKKIDAIFAETDIIRDAFSSFFNLDNCFTVTNFRFYSFDSKQNKKNGKLIFLSRINSRKGILDLIKIINDINSSLNSPIKLDIFGELYLNDSEKKLFFSMLNDNIKYCGRADFERTINLLSNYDFLCFPTKCEGEGVPGCIVESLMASTPIISSNFSQAQILIKNNYDSIIYSFDNLLELKQTLINYSNHEYDIVKLSKNARETGLKFEYNYIRKKFIELIEGKI